MATIIDVREYVSTKDKKIVNKFYNNINKLFEEATVNSEEPFYPFFYILIIAQQITETIQEWLLKKTTKSNVSQIELDMLQQLNNGINGITEIKEVIAGIISINKKKTLKGKKFNEIYS